MTDYISRDEAKDAFCDHCDAERGSLRCDTCEINQIPAADVRPVVRGKWTISEHEYLDCSVCGYSFYTGFDTMREAKEYLESGYTPNFCPNCGAKMEEQA